MCWELPLQGQDGTELCEDPAAQPSRAPLMCWELPPGARLARALCEDTASPARAPGDSPLPPSLLPPLPSPRLRLLWGQGMGGRWGRQ